MRDESLYYNQIVIFEAGSRCCSEACSTLFRLAYAREDGTNRTVEYKLGQDTSPSLADSLAQGTSGLDAFQKEMLRILGCSTHRFGVFSSFAAIRALSFKLVFNSDSVCRRSQPASTAL